MQIRESYKREFLESLRESPAWDLFTTQMLRYMHFIQDDVKFMMNGVAYKTQLIKEYMDSYSQLLKQGQAYLIRLDCNGVKIKPTNCLISKDGITWKIEEEVEKEFYITPSNGDVNINDVVFIAQEFFPNHLSCNDMKQLLSVEGIFNENVTYSSFDTVFSATSPYLLDYVLKRAEVPYRMEYFFLDEAEVETKGSRTEIVREGIYLKRAFLNQFYYKSDLILVPGKDYIIVNGVEYMIESVNNNTVVTSANVAEGWFTVKRTNYPVPLYDEAVLSSTLELEFSDIDLETARRVIKRVTPVRCLQGFKGKVDIRLYTTMTLLAKAVVPFAYKRTLVNLTDEISFMENQLLYNGPRPIVENGIRLIDVKVANTQYEQIILE